MTRATLTQLSDTGAQEKPRGEYFREQALLLDVLFFVVLHT